MRKMFLVALALPALAACEVITEAKVPMSDAAADAAGRQFAPPPPGKAVIYAFRADAPQPIVFTISVGRENLADLGTNTWARLEMPAGRADVRCTGGGQAATPSLLLDLAPGEIRYVEVRAEFYRIACYLNEVPAAQGRPAVLGGRRVREL